MDRLEAKPSPVSPEFRDALAARYLIEREIGRGGMAVVYRAHDLKHDRPIAIKVLPREFTRSLGRLRFAREIEVAAKLTHAHILTLHDSGEAAGCLYYVMPLVEGESLRDRLDRDHRLPLDEAVRIASEVASGLDYAHRRRVVHRDIKPGNILLLDDTALIADFGVARILQEVSGKTLTATGFALGTPAYMSPEQGNADRKLDGRSDVYSLGCVLYEMLTGAPPFTGRTPQGVIVKHLTAPIPMARSVRPDVPLRIEAVLAKSLAKAPGDRYATAAIFKFALNSVPLAERGRRILAHRWALAGLTALAFAIVVATIARVAFR